MGANLAVQAMEKGHTVLGWDLDHARTKDLTHDGLEGKMSVAELVSELEPPRIVFLYVPHGAPTDVVSEELKRLLTPGDIVVDGGNSHWEDSKRRHSFFADAGVRFSMSERVVA